MAINEDYRQTEVAAEVENAAKTLAHSTRRIPRPSDSYTLLGELHATTDHLHRVVAQLATWHQAVEDGVQYTGEDDRGDGATGTVTAAEYLTTAARHLDEATQAIMAAHGANGVVRWYDKEQ